MPRYRGYRESYSKRQQKEKRPGGLRAKIRRFWFLVKLIALIAIVGAVALLYYSHSLDRVISEKFDRPRRWDIPSKVYSDAEYLYPGLDIASHGIVSKLDRLGYRDAGKAITGPGDYSKADGGLTIYLHSFSYPDEKFEAFPVRLNLSGNVIDSIVKMDGREDLPLVRLEPEEIAAIFNEKMEDRTIVALNEVPRYLVEAVILVEDERFFEHKGVDPIGIVRAAIVNLRSMRIAQGGSTLTQQLVKNFFLYPKKSFTRKLNEMLIAYRIERTHTKAEILEAYLNEIYLGQRGASSVSGVEEASKLYFAKNASQLSLGECAMLAGMIKNPSKYNPVADPNGAHERRDFILRKMREAGLISEKEYSDAVAEQIVTPKRKLRIAPAPFFVDFVKRQLADFYPPEVLQTEGLRIFTTLDMFSQLAAEDSVVAELARLEKDFADILPKDHPDPLQACLVALQPSTGYVRALVGGRDYGASQFDRCTQAARQPGSTFKPFVYLTALDPSRSPRKYTPSTQIDDMSFEVESGGKMWSPKNYDKKEHGTITLRTALENSYNIATARLALDVGLENVVRTARDAGITSDLQAVPAMALGSFEVSPMEMASAYTIFPNGGILAQPISIINVVTKEGEVLEKKSISMGRKFDLTPVYLTTNIMKGVVDRGTAMGVRSRGYMAIAAGKTGTTSSYKDAWFVGFTPKLLALAWVGYDDNAEMKMSGARAALPIWVDFMKKAEPEGSGDFASPQNIILVKIDRKTGGLTNRSCLDGVIEAFIDGTEPTEECDELIHPASHGRASGGF